MKGLEITNADLIVYIHPSKANKVREAIFHQLSSLLFTYNEIFNGVVLAYQLDDQSEKAKILPGLVPHFGVKVKSTALVFSPRPNMLIEGKVVRLGKDSIHLVVLGFCSASIMSEDIRDDFKYKIKDGEEVYSSRSHRRHTIKVGSIINFSVKSLDEEILHISGSLIPDSTGCTSWLFKHGVKAPPDHSSRSEIKSKHGIEALPDHSSQLGRISGHSEAPSDRSEKLERMIKHEAETHLADSHVKKHRKRPKEEVEDYHSGLPKKGDGSSANSQRHKSQKIAAGE